MAKMVKAMCNNAVSKAKKKKKINKERQRIAKTNVFLSISCVYVCDMYCV